MSGLKLVNHGHICSALVLVSFGEGSHGLTQGLEGTEDDEDAVQARDWPTFIRRLRRAVYWYQSHNGGYNVSHMSVVIGAVTTSQPHALEAVKRFGFDMYGPVSYKKYPNHDLYHFVMSASEFIDRLDKYEDEIKVEEAKAAKAAFTADETPKKRTIRRPRTTRPAAAWG